MFDNHTGRRAATKFRHQLQRGIGIGQIVIAQILALHLPRTGHPARAGAIQIEGRGLMGIFAIAQARRPAEREWQRVRQGLALIHPREPASNHGVITRGVGKGGGRQPPPQRRIGSAPVRIQRRNQHGIIVRLGHNRDIAVVFGRRPDHRRAANVDIFDNIIAPGPAGHRGGKGIEVHHHQIDGGDAMPRQRRRVRRIAAHRQNAAMHCGVQRFHPAIQHFGKAGHIGNIAHHMARRTQRRRRAAR